MLLKTSHLWFGISLVTKIRARRVASIPLYEILNRRAQFIAGGKTLTAGFIVDGQRRGGIPNAYIMMNPTGIQTIFVHCAATALLGSDAGVVLGYACLNVGEESQITIVGVDAREFGGSEEN